MFDAREFSLMPNPPERRLPFEFPKFARSKAFNTWKTSSTPWVPLR